VAGARGRGERVNASMHAWREETRQDRLIQARIERDREAARAEMRIAERQALARSRREENQGKAAARQQAREARAGRRAARVAWMRAHTVDLLFVPVVIVPAVLAWTAMSAYGYLLYGPAGLALPAFSEGAMWAFAAAATITRRRHPERPVWHLRLGTVVFAAVGAALNFAHGMTASSGLHGPVTGSVYAAVSVAGVTVHQFVTAGPRRSRAERDAARIARAASRREMAARRAAVRHAVVELDADGNARLVYQAAPAILTRRHGRTRLGPAPGAGQAMTPAGPVCPWPRPVPVMAASPERPETQPPAVTTTAATASKAAAGMHPGSASGPLRRPQPRSGRNRNRKPVTDTGAEMHFATDLAAARVPSVRRIQRELHVGQPRAKELRERMQSIVTSTKTVQ
jgi:hypothetical protein